MQISISPSSTLVAVAVCVLSGCASAPQGDVERRAAELNVYGVGQLSANRYEVVSHVWVDSWRTAFWPPTYPTQEEAIASLRAEAARLGADGLVNVVCRDQGRSSWSTSAEPAILCYGSAIRVKPREG